ncbi:MAG: sigma-54-dependent Fis family transcriptional regulator [Armatimonadetes bacterium]|nr:sigma-54-dependent Fis family transcriptional regulator [Armatimonadota bacterium]
MSGRSQEERVLFEAWEKFVSTGAVSEPSCIRPEILESWKRSRTYGVDPFQKTEPIVLSREELRARREKNADLLVVATPYMEKLYRLVSGSNFVISLADQEGCVLKITGDPRKEVAFSCSVREGVFLTEQAIGTNGYGTVLVLRRPLQVWGVEHYCRFVHFVTCSCAPIYDVDGRLSGVIGMTGRKELVHHHSLGMVTAAADAITNELRFREVVNQKEATLSALFDGIVVINREGKIVYLNAAAEKILQATSQKLINKPLEQIFAPEAKEGFNGRLYEVLARGESLTDELVNLVLPTKVLRLHLTVRPWKTSAGTRSGTVLVIREGTRVSRMVTKYTGHVARFTFSDIIGKEPRFLEAVEKAKKVARSNCTVLLTGESGTGKDIFAQAIHNASNRREGPFVAINCAAVPRELLASELFGYEEGAFTGARKGGQIGKFELADGGTLFLDEIGDMPLDMQVVLLRVIEEKLLVRLGGKNVTPLDVRIIAATNRDLEHEVACGRFRTDLYYRLNVVKIHLPPLRERKGDIMLQVREFASRFLKKDVAVEEEAQRALLAYPWPGNVRELRNVIESVLASSDDAVIFSFSLPDHIRTAVGGMVKTKKIPIAPLKERELEAIQETLRLCNGNVALAARHLGVHRSTIYRKLGPEKTRKLGLGSSR